MTGSSDEIMNLSSLLQPETQRKLKKSNLALEQLKLEKEIKVLRSEAKSIVCSITPSKTQEGVVIKKQMISIKPLKMLLRQEKHLNQVIMKGNITLLIMG